MLVYFYPTSHWLYRLVQQHLLVFSIKLKFPSSPVQPVLSTVQLSSSLLYSSFTIYSTYCTVLHCSTIYCTAVLSTVLYCTALSTVLLYYLLYCSTIYCTAVLSSVLYCTALLSTVLLYYLLYCSTIYCTALSTVLLYYLYCTGYSCPSGRSVYL